MMSAKGWSKFHKDLRGSYRQIKTCIIYLGTLGGTRLPKMCEFNIMVRKTSNGILHSTGRSLEEIKSSDVECSGYSSPVLRRTLHTGICVLKARTTLLDTCFYRL